MIVSVVLSSPPYYGKIVDLRALAREVLFFSNTPGIASLLIFLPIMLLANFISPSPGKERWFLIFSITGMSMAFLSAGMIEQRSFL